MTILSGIIYRELCPIFGLPNIDVMVQYRDICRPVYPKEWTKNEQTYFQLGKFDQSTCVNYFCLSRMSRYVYSLCGPWAWKTSL